MGRNSDVPDLVELLPPSLRRAMAAVLAGQPSCCPPPALPKLFRPLHCQLTALLKLPWNRCRQTAVQLEASVIQPLAAAFKPAWPFVAQAAASMAAYAAGLAATQGAGMALRVSCATPIRANLLGAAGVAASSVLAGQAGRAAAAVVSGRRLQDLQPPSWPEMAVDALLGVGLFKVMGGQYHTLMPSDLSKVRSQAGG